MASTNVGEAAHITAAAKGGRRYDPGLQPSERSSIHNGIWLCAKCARMIDRDEVRYSVAVLHEWKQLAEDRATADIEGQARARPRRVGIPVAYDEQLATNLTPADAAELEALASEFANSTERALTETTRQRAARVSLQAVVEYLKRRGRTAHLEQLPEGSCNCPRALSGLALPLLVLHVDHVVVVLDDAANGLYCYVMDSTALDRDPLPLQEGWLRIDPACAYRAIVPLIEQRVRDSMLVVP